MEASEESKFRIQRVKSIDINLFMKAFLMSEKIIHSCI